MKNLLVLGDPIRHSKSPIIHNAWLKKHNIKAFYDKLKIKENELEGIIKKIKSNRIIKKISSSYCNFFPNFSYKIN